MTERNMSEYELAAYEQFLRAEEFATGSIELYLRAVRNLMG